MTEVMRILAGQELQYELWNPSWKRRAGKKGGYQWIK